MGEAHYIASDGSIMDGESFISYVYYLKKTIKSFSFIDWFCEDDFLEVKDYNYFKKRFQE